LQTVRLPGENRYVANSDMPTRDESGQSAGGPFVAGASVVVWLGNPRERFWGVLLGLSAAGVSLRGIDLNSFDDFVSQFRAGEPATPGEVFFPMHRVERIEMDLRNGDVPALGERFQSATGLPASSVLGPDHARSVPG
jgi:hypothetical protein